MSYDLLQQIGMGRLGMTEEEFWSCTPRAFFNAVEGFESLRKDDLEILRLQTLYQINPHIKKQIRDPKLLWRYPWDKRNNNKKTREEAIKGKEFVEKVKQLSRGKNDRDINF